MQLAIGTLAVHNSQDQPLKANCINDNYWIALQNANISFRSTAAYITTIMDLTA